MDSLGSTARAGDGADEHVGCACDGGNSETFQAELLELLQTLLMDELQVDGKGPALATPQSTTPSESATAPKLPAAERFRPSRSRPLSPLAPSPKPAECEKRFTQAFPKTFAT